MYGIESESHLGGYLDVQSPYGDPGTWGPEIWDKIIKDFNIASVLDIGCGMGYSTRYFSQKGLNATGIEGGDNAIRNAVHQNIIKNDYTKSPSRIASKFDLIWCCEFVEHVEERYLGNFIEDFKKGKHIAMTYAPPGQPGYHHVNLQEQGYWVEKIQKEGYIYNEKYSENLRNIAHECNSNKVFTHSCHLTKILFFKRVSSITQ